MSTCKICDGEYSKIRLHLRSHNIDPMEYWVKYFSDTHEFPKCLYCGVPIVTFTNDSLDCGPSAYCSKDCMNKDLPRVLSERHEQGIYEGTSYLTTRWNQDVGARLKSLARTSYRRLLREEDPFNEGFLYLVLINGDSLKIGATRQDLNYYLDLRYHYFDWKLLCSYKSNLLSVAGIEYLVKTSEKFSAYIQEGYSSSTEEFSLEIKECLISYLDNNSRLFRIK